MKSACLRDYKADLIAEMSRHRVGNKGYRIRYYINSKFFNIAKK